MDRLEDLVRERRFTALELYKKWVNGDLHIEDPHPPRTFSEYLVRLDYSSWFWTTISIVLLTVAVIPLVGDGPLLPLRYILGSFFVLFIPGYTLIEALYPEERSLSPLERVALSIGLSIALVPLIGLLLNYTPFGIRLYPVLLSLSALSSFLSFIGAYRKYEIVNSLSRVKK
jgi:uncharacterized membrane protein